MKKLAFRSELVDFLTEEFAEAAAEDLAEAAVVGLLRQGTLSASKGAELLGLSRWDFDQVLARHDIPTFDLLPDESMTEHLQRGDAVLSRSEGASELKPQAEALMNGRPL